MKFSIGYQMTEDESFVDTILKYRDRVYEVYFSFGDTPNGRHSQTSIEGLLPHEITARQLQELSRISAAGIPLNLLYNGNCYGEGALSRTFFNSIGDTVDYFSREFTLASVTTTSPLIARFIKGNFENIKTRASVNMEIGTREGMDYLSSVFDGYYAKREANRSFQTLDRLRDYCRANGKELFVFDFEYAAMSYPVGLDRYHFFTQTAVFEKHWGADEIIAYTGSCEGKWIDWQLYAMYLLDVISRFTMRESSKVTGDAAAPFSLWGKVLEKLI